MRAPDGLRVKLRSIDQSLTSPLTLPKGRGIPQILALGLAHSGDIPVWAVLLAAAWLLGDGRWKERAVVAIAGLALAEIVVIGIKTLVRRKRPPGEWGRIYRKADPFSFPSGHAARAVILCVVAWRMGPAGAFAAIAAWSPFMVISRIAIGIHYVFDVVAGLILGGLLVAVLLAVAQVFVSAL